MSFDAYGFPTDQQYVPSSRSASLGAHQQQWARFWWAATHNGRRELPAALRHGRELRRLVWGGIPAGFRGDVWCQLLGVTALRRARAGYFDELCEAASLARDDDAAAQIAKDVERTWPRHRFLDPAALQRVLQAFSRHNRAIGYCQGLNVLAAVFLAVVHLSEEDAFWCLVQLTEARIAEGFWSETLWRCRAEQEVLNALVKRRMPAAYRKLLAARLSLELFSTGWWLTLFASDLPIETALRVWDVLFLRSGGAGGVAAAEGGGGRAEGAPAGMGPADAADGLSVVLAASLALIHVNGPALRRGSPLEAGETMRAAPHGLQPGSPAGIAFTRRFRQELSALRRAPIAPLRQVAIQKVTDRLQLVQSVREGTATTDALHADPVSATISVGEGAWLRSFLTPPESIRMLAVSIKSTPSASQKPQQCGAAGAVPSPHQPSSSLPLVAWLQRRIIDRVSNRKQVVEDDEPPL